ncbi:transmembrane 7 superfamily member 3 [Biomphalaria glabrata]
MGSERKTVYNTSCFKKRLHMSRTKTLNMARQNSYLLFLVVVCSWDVLNGDILELESVGPSVITLAANKTLQAWTKGSFNGLSFIKIQFHSQFSNVSLSSDSTFSYSTTKSGSSVGMIQVLKLHQQNVTWYIRVEGTENVTAIYYLEYYFPDDPLPGGCNQVFNLEVDPSIVLLSKLKRTDVWFQWASLAVPIGQDPINCELQKVRDSLTYDVYTYFLSARDQSLEEFIHATKKMLTTNDIIKYGTKVTSVSDGPNSKSLVAITSEPNQGVVYAVIVTRKDTGRQAAYVTTVTYSCDHKQGECSSQLTAVEIIVPIILGFCGLFLMALGHNYFKTTQCFFGYIFTSLLLYIVISTDPDQDETVKLAVSLSLGVVGGLLWLLFWWYYQFPTLSVFLVGLCAGYLMSSVLFFTPFGNIVWWMTEMNYSLAFLCGILIYTVALLAYYRLLCITSCSLVGSFQFLMTFGIPLRSSFRSIFLNSIYHQTMADYLDVTVIFPCNTQDIVLFTFWPVLVVVSIFWQFYRERPRERYISIRPILPVADDDVEQDNSGDSLSSQNETARLLTSRQHGYGAVPRRSRRSNNNLVT